MNKIFKYSLDHPGRSKEVQIPYNAEILDIQVQRNVIALWAIVEENPAAFEKLTVTSVCTGEVVPENIGTYYKTVQLNDGDFVAHIFIKREVI